MEVEGGWGDGDDPCCSWCSRWYWARPCRIRSALDIGCASLIVGLFEAGGIAGGGDSLSGLTPTVTSSWSNSAVSVSTWNQHTYRTNTDAHHQRHACIANITNERNHTAMATSMNGKSESANPLVILIASFRDFLHLLRYTVERIWPSSPGETPTTDNACESVRRRMATVVCATIVAQRRIRWPSWSSLCEAMTVGRPSIAKKCELISSLHDWMTSSVI